MGTQEQVTEIGRDAANFHDTWLLLLCAVISVFVLGAAAVGDRPLPPRRQPGAVAQFAQHADRSDLDGGPGADPGRDRGPVDPADAARNIRRRKADLTVKVIGNQWYWTYQYPDNGGFEIVSNMLKEAERPDAQTGQRFRKDDDGPPLLAVDERLVIPAGKVVKFLVTSNDVIHAFAVPAFWTKIDANPGMINETWVKVDRPGVYFGQCSELCGARHAYMPIAVEVVSEAQFAAWVASKGGTMPGPKPAPTRSPRSRPSPSARGTPAAAAPNAEPTAPGQPAPPTRARQPRRQSAPATRFSRSRA